MKENFDAQIAKSTTELFDYISQRTTEEQLQRIIASYRFAAEAHKTQLRRSGEPYITHPIAVASILARELEMTDNTVITAFLHDVVEDTDHTVEEIRELFGDDVAFLWILT